MVDIYLGVAVLVIIVAFVVVPARELRRTLSVSRRPERIEPDRADERDEDIRATEIPAPPVTSSRPMVTRQPIILRSMPATTAITRAPTMADRDLHTFQNV